MNTNTTLPRAGVACVIAVTIGVGLKGFGLIPLFRHPHNVTLQTKTACALRQPLAVPLRSKTRTVRHWRR
jgi:hypothetical protein